MVLKAHHHAAPGAVLAPEAVVADHPLHSPHGVQIQSADKVAALAVIGLVIAAQHLVAAADGEEGDAIFNGGFDLPVLAPVQIGQQHLLLEILAAADEHQVEAGQGGTAPDGQPGDAGLNAPPLQPPGHTYHIAPVAIEVQHIRVHMADFQFHKPSLTSRNRRRRSGR